MRGSTGHLSVWRLQSAHDAHLQQFGLNRVMGAEWRISRVAKGTGQCVLGWLTGAEESHLGHPVWRNRLWNELICSGAQFLAMTNLSRKRKPECLVDWTSKSSANTRLSLLVIGGTSVLHQRSRDVRQQ